MSAEATTPAEQVARLVEDMERIDWTAVDGVGVGEAAAIQQRLREAADR